MSNVLTHYNYLHAIPEPGLQEFKTAAYLAAKLEAAGYAVTCHIGGATGIVGIYDSGLPGPVLGIRADMDALTHIIDGKTIQRHTCGHDAHCAMLLTAAEEIIAENSIKKGKLKIIFQPAEETGAGAKIMLEAGVIDDIDILLGMHIRPIQECRSGQIIEAMYYSSSCTIKAIIKGIPAHGARPHLGVNAIDGAIAAITAVNAIHMNPVVACSAKCTRFLCDSGVTNAIPERAAITFDIRAQYNDTMKELKEKVIRAIHAGAATVGATVESLEIPTELPAAELDPEITKILGDIIVESFGKEALCPPFTTPGGEDFFWYTSKLPHLKAGFTGLGVDAEPGLHHPDMHFDLSALENGVIIHKKSIIKFLNESCTD